MMAAMAPESKRVPPCVPGPQWYGPDRLLDWRGRARARTGPTTATNGSGPVRFVPIRGVEVNPTPRCRSPKKLSPSREIQGPCLLR
jgi:hypothetical protein